MSSSSSADDPISIGPATAEHLPAIRAIYNDVIANTTAIYDDRPMSEADALAWFEAKRAGGYPLLAATSAGGELLGYASYGEFNPRPGYRPTAEHSLHVAPQSRGRGVGRRLLAAIEEAAQAGGRRVLVGLIDAENAASRRLHESAGYEEVGRLNGVARKFDRWLDLCLYQKRLG